MTTTDDDKRTQPGEDRDKEVFGDLEGTVEAELARIDPHLAGMFRHGVEIQQRVAAPGMAFVLGSITREITSGVVRHLARAGGLPEPSLEQIEELQQQREKNRANIAAMLGLAVNHPSVDGWFHFTSSLPRLAHYSSRGINADEALAAFEDVKKFLFTQLGGYFDTRTEIDALLAIAVPSATTIKSLARLLSRPAQRRHFFSRLLHPGWAAPLLAAGYLPNAPDLPEAVDGQIRLSSWNESEYLRRVAAAVPDVVTEAVEAIAQANAHPYVWKQAADIGCVVPQPFATRVAKHLSVPYRRGDLAGTYGSAVQLVARLSADDPASAICLTKTLLRVKSAKVSAEDDEARWTPVPWPFHGLRRYDFEQFFAMALPQLARQSPLALLRLTLHVLNQCIVVARKEGHDARTSAWWAERLDHAWSAHEDDARALLASVAVVAMRAIGPDSSHQREALTLLDRFASSDVYTRLKLVLFAEFPQEFKAEIGDVLRNPDTVEPPFEAVEVAALLRKAYELADQADREAFAAAVRTGPADDISRGAAESEDTSAFRAEWRRARIRWFHDRIPLEFEALARSLDVKPAVPTSQQQSLDETGHYIGPVTSGKGRTQTPKSADDLAGLSASEIFRFLQEYDPLAAIDGFGLSAFDGLPAAVSEFAYAHPARALEVLGVIALEAVPQGRYVSSLLGGVEKHAEHATAVLSLVPGLLAAGSRVAANGPSPSLQHWRWVARACVEITLTKFAEDAVDWSEDAVGAAWNSIGALCDAESWSARAEGDEGMPGTGDSQRQDFGMVLGEGLNHIAGKITRAAVFVGLWQYRGLKKKGVHDETAALAAGKALSVVLERMIRQTDSAALIACSVEIGRFIPQIHLLDREWVLAASPRLFADGAANPFENPAWGGYVSTQNVYDSVLRDMRPWYLVAAQQASPDTLPSRRSTYSLTKHLASHVTWAYVLGFVNLEEEDRLLEVVYERVPVHDRTSVYSELFQSGAYVETTLQRLEQFWRWRLDSLDQDPTTPGASDEYEGLAALLAVVDVPDESALVLGLRTLRGARGEVPFETQIWRRLTQLASRDPIKTFPLIDTVARGAMSKEWPLFTFDMVAPALTITLRAEDRDTTNATTKLIHDLGDRGYEEFGQLLRPGAS